jgi:predicted Zn-dependent peptidase
MVFKGTRRRSAEAISREIDALGGELNAFTSREGTTFYAKVLDEHLTQGLDLLADIFHHSRFDARDVTKEKQVVLEEIRMVEDEPEEFLHDLHTKNALRSHPLGRPVLGDVATIEALRRTQLLSFRARHYHPSRVVVAVAGNFAVGPVLKQVAAAFGGPWECELGQAHRIPPTVTNGLHVRPKPLEQAHICVGTKGLAHNDKDRYAVFALNAILGGGVSSRLFQEVREKRGLAYSIYSSVMGFTDSGLVTVYAGVRPGAAPRAIGLILKELRRLQDHPVGRAELERAKSQLKGTVMLGLESSSSRMTKLAKDERYFGCHIPLRQVMADIDAISADQLGRLGRELFDARFLTVTALGPLQKGDIARVMR